jgi:hypothetical protein
MTIIEVIKSQTIIHSDQVKVIIFNQEQPEEEDQNILIHLVQDFSEMTLIHFFEELSHSV